MPRQRREMGSGAAPLQESSATAAAFSPSESEIATIAYQLWIDRGCPIGSDQEDWSQAEEMLKNAFAAQNDDRLTRSSIPSSDPRTEILAAFPWEGHWEIWEREWVCARWVWDVRASRVGVSGRARSALQAA